MAERVSSSRFVGREAELDELGRALSGEDLEAVPALFYVAGESGVGKTRLLREVIARAEENGAAVIGGSCIELGDDELPYAPLVAALRPLQRAGSPVLDELSSSARAELARLNPAIGEPSTEPETERGEAQRRLFDAFLELISRLGAERPALLWIEDIHWADHSTRSFLRFLAGSLRTERVVVVATYRADELHRRHPLRPLLVELERPERARRVELPRFDLDELTCQLTDILGTEPERVVVERLYGRSEGNPLFTEELLAAGIDGRGSLPPSLREALLLRVERLSEPCRRLLRLLAIAGRADEALLAEAACVEPAELSTALREAIDSHIVIVEGERFAFRHALLREVIYDDLLPGERADIHLKLAAGLETRARSDGSTFAATAVAHHYHAAGDQPQALTAALAAADAVRGLHAYGEAAALMDRAVELWPRVDDPEQLTGLDRGTLLERAARIHFLAGDDSVAEAIYRQAVEAIEADGDNERLASVLGRLAAAQWALGKAELSRETQRRGLELLEGDEDSPARARLLAQRVRFFLLQGRYESVVEAAPDAIAATARLNLDSERSGVLNRYGCALFSLGREEEARERLLEAIAIAERTGTSDDLATAYLNFADALHVAGLSSESRQVAEKGVRRIHETADGSIRSMRFIRLNLAEVYFDLGEWGLAEAELREAQAGETEGVGAAHAHLRTTQLALARGENEQAREALDIAERLLKDALEPQYIAVLATLRAELDVRDGELGCARAAIDSGIERMLFCSDDGTRLALVAAEGVAVEAEIAERARDLGDSEAERKALSRADRFLEMVAAATEDGERRVERALLAATEAQHARVANADDPALWAAAASAWERLERPYPQAIALWRQAQAALARADRAAAAPPLAHASALAGELGAAWLAGETDGLAARARLSLEEPASSNGGGAGPAEQEEETPFGLTRRELQVLELVASGATNREIGEQLYMAEKTASVHVSRILAKLGVRGRTEAAAVAHRHGIGAAVET